MSEVREPAPRPPRRRSLTVWIDAPLSPAIAAWLTADCGVEAASLRAVGLTGATDSDVFEAAGKAGIDAVLTKDADFADLVRRRGPPPQVVLLRCGNVSNAVLRSILADAWPRVAACLRREVGLVEIDHIART